MEGYSSLASGLDALSLDFTCSSPVASFSVLCLYSFKVLRCVDPQKPHPNRVLEQGVGNIPRRAPVSPKTFSWFCPPRARHQRVEAAAVPRETGFGSQNRRCHGDNMNKTVITVSLPNQQRTRSHDPQQPRENNGRNGQAGIQQNSECLSKSRDGDPIQGGKHW